MAREASFPDDGERRPNIVHLGAARARRHELAVADFAAALFDDELDNDECEAALLDALRRMDRDHVRRLQHTVSEVEMWAQVDDILAGA
jgi:hypothetical protein